MKTAHSKRLLIIDDDRLFCDSAAAFLSGLPVDIFLANSGKEGLAICAENKIDIVLLDQKLPDAKGSDLYTSILSGNDQAKIIFITAFPDLKRAVQALKDGVYDYITKPFEPEELALLVTKTIKTIDLERVARFHEYAYKMQTSGAALVGSSQAMDSLRQMITRAAGTQAPVFITGETGTGKNMVAKAIHYGYSKSDSPFIIVNCAAIPENLIESELFGVEKGAFTGAIQTNKGLFELAEGGTLFLDEIGELPTTIQSKFLGVLDEKKFKKIGGHKMIDVDVRIIAATNVDMDKALKEKSFRNDVYFRLNIIPIQLPPLRERKEDIPELTHHFISQFSKKTPLRISSDEIKRLQSYDWPGNIRELSNIIERSIILRNSEDIFPSTLIENSPTDQTAISQSPSSISTLKAMESAHIRNTLSIVSGNYTRAAKILGISRSTLMRKIEVYGLTNGNRPETGHWPESSDLK